MPVLGWKTYRETVTVAVLFMNPTLVTCPTNDMGGMAGDKPGEGKGRRGGWEYLPDETRSVSVEMAAGQGR